MDRLKNKKLAFKFSGDFSLCKYNNKRACTVLVFQHHFTLSDVLANKEKNYKQTSPQRNQGDNMKPICERKLTPTEVNRHFIRIEKKYRDIFPSAGEAFKIVVEKEKLKVTIDKQGRIWASKRKSLAKFNEGDTIIFSKKSDDTFNVSIER